MQAKESLGKFITTEPLNQPGEQAEKRVWQRVCQAFADRHCIAYWRYPIFSKVGQFRKEPDILIADAELGLIVIEVKSIAIDQIVAIQGHCWELQQFYTTRANPYQQAEHQLFAVLEYCAGEPSLHQNVYGRAVVALPQVTQDQWQLRGFDQLPSCPPILFQGDLLRDSVEFVERIEQFSCVVSGKKLSLKQWQVLQGVISGTALFLPPSRKFFLNQTAAKSLTRGAVLAQVRQRFIELDLQQEQIAKSIPHGPQRIRGIAGSGKTVLLCQRVAQMHLKYPDWDIALVFFSRSLYDLICYQVDQWLRRFSLNELGYDRKNQKLKILHAWGSKQQPGLYSTICQAAGVYRHSVQRTVQSQPNEGLAEACCYLLQKSVIPQIFDAILIDEGQDFLVKDELKYEGKQPFYWMAYQALRPVEGETQKSRRLIWAYDDIQSLDGFKTATASELFGDDWGQFVTGQYENGINKTELMARCYRVPSPILNAAYGIGFGLLRPAGVLTAMTRVEDWEALDFKVINSQNQNLNLGQQVTGTGQRAEGRSANSQPSTVNRQQMQNPKSKIQNRITLERSISLNPVPELWQNSVIEFEAYRRRKDELMGLSDRLFYNLKIDGLRPSREILVIILGTGYEAMKLEWEVARFLMEQGLDIYIPGTNDCNLLKPDPANPDPNRFWCEGGITISRIHRAKGNEADMVYLVGLDQIAENEANLSLRNQLFVALTRSRGWVRLSGIGAYPFYEELTQVIKSGNTFNFPFKQHPQRQISVTDVGELLHRYRQGDRNFEGLNLAGVDLSGVNLSQANLIRANLAGANLTDANFSQTKLIIANLNSAQMQGVQLQGAKLVSATLTDVNLSEGNLNAADLSYADLRNANLQNALLSDANFSYANLTGAILEGANLDQVNLTEAIF